MLVSEHGMKWKISVWLRFILRQHDKHIESHYHSTLCWLDEGKMLNKQLLFLEKKRPNFFIAKLSRQANFLSAAEL